MTDFNPDIEQCLQVLAAGGVILYPTDTLWGLGCDATNSAAVRKLLQLKGKPQQKGVIVILATERDVLQYVAGVDLAVFDYLKTVDRPTTVVYENGLGIADEVLNADATIAIRLVNDEFCRHLVKRFRKPIVSTSANFHGEPAPENFKVINPDLKMQVDYMVQHRQNDEGIAAASAMIRWHNDGTITVLR